MKKPRVKTIKDNIQPGTPIPIAKNDCETGQYVDQLMSNKGHVVDKNGIVDLPELDVDNKSRKWGSKANHTVGSLSLIHI